ncbi:alpha/beta hydrolase [Polaromonas jejuensis]|uniref:Alpha/beta hydrolase n=1 Tax=Polaromonas jejuensis TaxID=457502 RepID=A0ABW0QHK0_9BURK|nr:alpha/beta hydrolase [Polaromonas jejuensis]
MHSTVLAPFTTRDGENLALYEWPIDAWDSEMGQDAPPPRAVVLIVHGLGEHASRYEHVASRLLDWGFAVRAYDQRGHGESGGARGVLPNDTALLDDLAEIVDDTRLHRRHLPHGAGGADGSPLPLILLGHSLGGLVVSRFVALNMRPVDGLVMSSSALDAGLNGLQKLLLAVMPTLAPNLCVGNGLDARYLSHDPKVVQRYLADRRVHNKISARLGKFIADAGPATVAAAARWRTPTLLMYAGADRLVNPAGSRAFAETAASSPAVKPGMVSTKCFDGFYHELFNEVDAAPVFDVLKAWLDARF